MGDGTLWKSGKGLYTLNDLRFYYDPIEPKDGGKHRTLRKKVIKTPAGVAIQTWAPSLGDKDQEFKWKHMPTEFYDRLDVLLDDFDNDPDTTHELVFHWKDPEEIWNIHITSLEGKFDRGYGSWKNVKLKFTIVSQVS